MTMYAQKTDRNLTLHKIVTEASNPIPIEFTEGEIYFPPTGAGAFISAQGTLAVSGSVTLNGVTVVANRALILLINLTSSASIPRPPIVQISHAMAGVDPVYRWEMASTGETWLLKLFINEAQQSVTILNSAENQVGTVLNYNAKYGDGGIWLPRRKFIV